MPAAARSITRALLLASVLSLLVPTGASADAQHPDVSTFTHTGNLVPLGSSPYNGGGFNSDLAFWGNKAYQGNYNGFRILDISDPSDPKSLINYTDCAGNQGDVIVWNNILVRSWNSANTAPTKTCDGDPVLPGFEGLHVFDVSNPADPDLVASVPLPCGSHTATAVPDPANGRLLVYNSASGAPCSWTEIVSVPSAAPQTAALAGVFQFGRGCHDVAVILGSAMKAACAGGNGISVVSLGGAGGGSLTAPVQLWSKSFDGVSIGHAATFSWDGEVVVFGHEPGGGTQARCKENDPDVNKTVWFLNSGTGAELGRWVLPRNQGANENCTIHNFNVIPSATKNILVSGNYQSGISVVDFTDPANATEIGYADPAPLGANLIAGGDWSTYWYNGYLYESDITRGLLVWKLINDPGTPGADGPPADAHALERLNPQTQEFTIT